MFKSFGSIGEVKRANINMVLLLECYQDGYESK